MNIYDDIRVRTNSQIYLGIVGPVRSGKSTFIKKFMDTIVIPNIEDEALKERAIDELPQSASGRTIMTTEPKFIPEQAVSITIEDSASLDVRLIDCVGYIVPSAIGYIEEDQPRMVKTPWFEDAIPFNMAAELGTKKVITEHSTIGLVITTDGSITDIPREEYQEAEERVIEELNETGKPYVIILNCVEPNSESSVALANSLSEKYKMPVMPINCIDVTKEKIKEIIAEILFQFPVQEIKYNIPPWVLSLDKGHWLKDSIVSEIKKNAKIEKVKEIKLMLENIEDCSYMQTVILDEIQLGTGKASVSIVLDQTLFFKILGEKTGIELKDETSLYKHLMEMAEIKERFKKLQSAYDDVLETGYGIVMPDIDELALEEPEIIKQNGKYGIKLKATAPSIHMMKTNICTELTPIVGSEQQSEDLIAYLLNEFEENPSNIWQSNMFGKSLHELVNEGLHGKLVRMPEDARTKVRQTIERVINEGCNGLICIII
ncbi:MAG: stage IV sporulation protein A [Clostridia bacterium]